MKRIILLIALTFTIFLLGLFNFLQTNSTKKTDEFVEKRTKEIIELKFGHHMPQGSLLDKAAHHFADEVEKKTQGKVQITVYPNQKLGNSHQMLELSRAGAIDILLTATAKMSVTVPSMQYADLSFLFPTKEDAYALLDGKVGKSLLRTLNDVELIGVAFWDGGFKNFTANKPLIKLEDFNDLKIRVMKCRVIMEQFTALKAKPITIDFHATKQALKDGSVNAQENPLDEIVSMGFYEVQSNLTLSEHAYLPYVLSFSKKTFSKLPFDIQTILMQTASETTSWERKESLKNQKKYLDIIKNAGVNIHTLSSNERQKFIQVTSYIMKKYENVIGSDIISKTQEYFYKKENKQDVVVIGIDADLSMGAKGSGLAIKRGVELAVDKINNAGGLLGKKVVVLAKDHQGISTQARENIQEFIDDKNVIALIGGKHSAIISSYTKELQENKLIFFSPWAAATSVTENGYVDNYIFRVSLNDKYATHYLAKQALKQNSSPLIVVENSIWGKEALANINLYFISKGLQKQEGVIINRGESQFENFFQAIKTNKYDSIIMVLNSQEAQRLVKYMGESNMTTPIISHWGIVGDSFFQANKEYLKDIDLQFIQTFSLQKFKEKKAQELVENYLQTYHQDSDTHINAITGVAQAYDSVMLLAKAVEQAKSFDSQKIKDSLEHLKSYEGIVKTYKNPFSKTDHDALNMEDFFMAKFNKNGYIEPIKE